MTSPPYTTLHQLFLRQAERRPHALAIDSTDPAQRLTYGELDARSAQVASHLVQRGAMPNDRIALCLPRSADAYITILGVLRAGAAYVPIDVETPEERARFTVEDSDARLIITTPDRVERFAATGRPCLALDEVPLWSADVPLPQIAPDDLCYVIYTSGTTGRPKGVCISHRNALTYVEGILQVTGVHQDDRVIQGFSLAFDASVEQIWMALATGGALVVADQQMMRVLDELPAKLRALGITVFSTVPTVLSMLDPRDQPQLRLLITGGEAARPELVTRWAAPGRRILNSYGPTETTVVATCAFLQPGDPITIGKPLPQYEVLIVDEALRPVADGAEGELCIGGPGVSLRGYLNRPELNAQKFLLHEGRRFYRTGDLVCQGPNGDILFRGRIDTQVKVRGFRVELEEIENHTIEALAARPEADAFQGVIVAVQEGPGGAPQLVAYLVQRFAASLDVPALLATLRKALPHYMVPTHFASLEPDEVPRLTSGKIDRKRLPSLAACRPVDLGIRRHRDDGHDPLECRILEIWREVLRDPELGRTGSFFDHGGNSVLAVQAIARFREAPELASVTIRDLYESLTAETVAARVRQRGQASTSNAGRPSSQLVRVRRTVPRGQFLAVATAQTLVILTALSLGGVFAFGAIWASYQVYVALSMASNWPWLLAAGVPAVAIIGFVGTLALGVGAKWLLVGRYTEMDCPVWSWGYFRWWLSKLLLLPAQGLAGTFLGTPLAPFFYRLLGARIGNGVYLGVALDEPDLVTIEDNASIADMAILRTHSLQDGKLRLRRIHVGKGSFVGCRGMICGGARLGDKAVLHPQSCLVEGTLAPVGTEWQGSPARQIKPGTTALSRLLARHERESGGRGAWTSAGEKGRTFLLQLLHGWALAVLGLVPLAVEVLLLLALGVRPNNPASFSLLVLLPASFLFAAIRFGGGLGTILAGKWLLTGRARAGTLSLSSYAFVRRWFCGRLMGMLVNPGSYRPITETLLMVPFCRWLGMKAGRRIEMSDAMGLQPDLVTLGDGAMLADAVALGAPIIHYGMMTLGHVKIGERCFLGNGSQVPLTTPELGAGSLLGVASITPDEPPAGSDWLGSPPMRLPNRVHWSGPAARTFSPPARLVALRWLFGIVKMVLPGALQMMLLWMALKVGLVVYLGLGATGLLALMPLLTVGMLLAAYAIPVTFKWALIGRYRPGQVYLWSAWMWTNELVFETDTVPSLFFGPLLSGTPWLPVYYRAMGARIGKQVCMHRSILIEADLVTLGDHVVLEGFPQTHLFEDRVMKLGTIHIEEGVSVGSGATVLYDTRIGTWASIGDASLVMKHETLQPGRRYRGLPVESVEGPANVAVKPPPADAETVEAVPDITPGPHKGRKISRRTDAMLTSDMALTGQGA
jgi:non-ribosomal peptide synthetase-like protein